MSQATRGMRADRLFGSPLGRRPCGNVDHGRDDGAAKAGGEVHGILHQRCAHTAPLMRGVDGDDRPGLVEIVEQGGVEAAAADDAAVGGARDVEVVAGVRDRGAEVVAPLVEAVEARLPGAGGALGPFGERVIGGQALVVVRVEGGHRHRCGAGRCGHGLLSSGSAGRPGRHSRSTIARR
jgi:hypothetical protein